MEQAPLNMAHFHGRKADNHLRHRRFDEAMDSHQKAADCLQIAMETVNVSSALESLRLQRDHHMKRKEFMRTKKQQHDRHMRTAHQQEQLHAALISKMSKDQLKNSSQLRSAIHKTMESADILLEELYRRNEHGSSQSTDELPDEMLHSTDVTVKRLVESSMAVSHSRPVKSDKLMEDCKIIDDLRDTNNHLHRLFLRLVAQLDETVQQADALRQHVSVLETMNARSQATPTAEDEPNQQEADEPCDEQPAAANLPTDAAENEGDLPALAPLELPCFDYDSLKATK